MGIGEDLFDGLVGPATRLIESCPVPAAPNSPSRLTRRQNEVLIGIGQNLTNKEIGSRLNLTKRTVKFHVSALLEKSHVKRRGDLLLEAEGFLREVEHKRGEKPRAPLKEVRGMAVALLRPAEIAPAPIPMRIRSSR